MRMLCKVKLSEHKYKTPEGYLYCKDAIIARTGKQTYLESEIYEGSTSDKYIDIDRTEEEVFSPATMASFENKPLTIDHPDQSVGPENYKSLSVGHVQNVRKGEYEGQPVMLADIIVNDAEAISLIESGEMTELSCGYDCDITEGDHPEQINIRGNHVALCEAGRAGIAMIIDSWGAKPIQDSISKGTLIQEFGKQGKQYKIARIINNVIYAESLETGRTVLFKKDEENIEWAVITKSEVKDSIKEEKEVKDEDSLVKDNNQVSNELIVPNENLVPKQYIISLNTEEESWLDVNDKPTNDKTKARKFKTYEEAEAHKESYCKGSIQELVEDTYIKDEPCEDSLHKDEELEEIENILKNINFKNLEENWGSLTINFKDKKEMKKAAKKLVEKYDLEIIDDEGEYCIIIYDKFIKDSTPKEWTGFDLLRGPASKEFKDYLRDRGLYFEPSSNGDFVHFEVKNADEFVAQRVEDIRRHWAEVKDNYSKKFYSKMIKELNEQLKKLEKNELLDENNHIYEKQKNKIKENIKRQIKEYQEKLEL